MLENMVCLLNASIKSPKGIDRFIHKYLIFFFISIANKFSVKHFVV